MGKFVNLCLVNLLLLVASEARSLSEESKPPGNKKGHTCLYNGVEYKESDELPTRGKCWNCTCREGFTEPGPVLCASITCLTLQKPGCEPVYDENECCPVAYNCGNSSNSAPALKPCKCETNYFKHYEVKNCKPIFEDGCDCPVRYECPPTFLESNEGCYFNGKTYKLKDKIETSNPCRICSCEIAHFHPGVRISCILVECPSAFGVVPLLSDGCYQIYALDKCCSIGQKCVNSTVVNGTVISDPTCELDGKIYHVGQHMYPKDDPCLICVCDEQWTGPSPSSCRILECMLERDKKLLQDGCLPIYHEGSCCPCEYHCATSEKEEVIPSNETVLFDIQQEDPLMQCTFGGKNYNFGDVLYIKHPTYCVTCTCSTPPEFTCIHKYCPRISGIKRDTCKTVFVKGECCPRYECAQELDCPDIPCELPCQKKLLTPDSCPVCDCVMQPVKAVLPPTKAGHTCLYNGVEYKEGDELPTRGKCWHCTCREGFTEPGPVLCASITCLTLQKPGCEPVYDENECCPVAYNCGNSSNSAPALKTCKCETNYFKHYEVKNCKPIFEEGCDCPVRYECPPTFLESNEGCYFNGKTYKLKDKIETSNPCEICSCETSHFHPGVRISCILVECPSAFRPTPLLSDDCYQIYALDACCTIGQKCVNSTVVNGTVISEPTCELDGKIYHLGQHIYPKDDPCLICVCDEQWTGPSPSSCRILECMLERDKKLLQDGCLPIYRERSCCPIEYHCATSEKEEVIPSNETDLFGIQQEDPLMQCTFGGKKYNFGDVLYIKHPTYCVTCTCSTPPEFTCIHKYCPRISGVKRDTCKTVFVKGECCPRYECVQELDCPDIPCELPCQKKLLTPDSCPVCDCVMQPAKAVLPPTKAGKKKRKLVRFNAAFDTASTLWKKKIPSLHRF